MITKESFYWIKEEGKAEWQLSIKKDKKYYIIPCLTEVIPRLISTQIKPPTDKKNRIDILFEEIERITPEEPVDLDEILIRNWGSTSKQSRNYFYQALHYARAGLPKNVTIKTKRGKVIKTIS